MADNITDNNDSQGNVPHDPRISLRPGGRVTLRKGGVVPNLPDKTTLKPSQQPVDDTLRPSPSRRPLSMSQRPAGTDSFRPGIGVPPRAQTLEEKFTVNGITYERQALLSSTTGEAEILLVTNAGRQYVLKLYYKGYYPSTEVLDRLKANGGNGALVQVIDYQLWTSASGDERFAVVMTYYTGGVLRGGQFRGKAADLERFAVQAMDAISHCHNCGILHKDIKPNNFIYTDDTTGQIVLSDFGIASTFERGLDGKVIPFVNINQNRTYIYASPEIFNITVQRPDGRVEVEYSDVKSDYFALGMTLLVLWMGEAPFALLDERSLLKLKRGELSGLPYPEEIPHHVRNLIKGLTLPEPDKRWGHEEFERWVKGEDVDVETTVKSRLQSLNILFDPAKGLVATSLRQLADYMLSDPDLGQQYLYTGRLSRWMVEAGLPEWQMRFDSIVNKQYPRSRRSGLLAACYRMNPDLPFVGIHGDRCYNKEQIARELTRHADEYSVALRDWDAPLYVYFSVHAIDTGVKFQPLFKSNPWIALWRMAYTISPECEFPIWSTVDSAVVWCSTVDQLIDEYAKSSHDRYASFNVRTPIGKYTPLLLTDECFVTWLAARDTDLADTVRAALDSEKSGGSELYTYIFFLLDKTRNFFYRQDDTEYFTPAHIGALVNQDMVDYYVTARYDGNQHFYNEQHRRIEQLAHYRDTKIYYYLKSRGCGDETFDYIDGCFDIHSKSNRRKPGPYNSRLAILKVCHWFAGGSFYHFPVSNITVSTVAELAEVPLAERQEELNKGFLTEWLAVQYHENPNLDTSDEHAYERMLLKFMEAIEAIDPQLNEVVRYRRCRDDVEGIASSLRGAIDRISMMKGIMLTYVVAIAVMILAMRTFGVLRVPVDDVFTYNWRNMAYLALPLFAMMMVPPVQSYVNDKTKGFLGSPLLFAIVVSNFIVIGWEVLRLYILPYSDVTVPILYGLVGIWILFSTVYKRGLRRRDNRRCIHPDFETSYIEPLYYTWRDSNEPYKEFDSSVYQQSKQYGLFLKGIYDKLKSSVKFLGVWTVLLIVGFCLLCTPVSDAIRGVVTDDSAVTSQQYDDEDVSIYICDVETALTVRDAPTANAGTVGTLDGGTIVEVIGFDGDYARIIYDGSIAYVLKKYLKPI